MKLAIRLWLTRLLVVAIAMSGGLNGYAAYAMHGDHDSIAHVLGLESGKHDHERVRTSGSRTHLPFCQIEAPCHEEPGNGTSHVHFSYCGPVAVTTGEMAVAYAAASAAIGVDLGSLSPLGQILYPPFKPPRAAL